MKSYFWISENKYFLFQIDALGNLALCSQVYSHYACMGMVLPESKIILVFHSFKPYH